MADFCKQCSQELGAPEGWSDLEGADTNLQVLCEGCGWIYVDEKGSCVSCDQHKSSGETA